MAFVLLLVSAFILYAKSKYFPATLHKKVAAFRRFPQPIRLVAYGLSGIAMWMIIQQYDGLTGFLIWSFALMASFGILIIGLPLIYKS